MESISHSSVTSNSVPLLEDVIKYYYARKKNNHEELHSVKKRIPELFNYQFNIRIFEDLENFLTYRYTHGENNLFHYVTLWKLYDKGESDLLHLLLKYNILDIEKLEEYPEIHCKQSEKQSNALIAWKDGLEYRNKFCSAASKLCDLYALLPFLSKLRGYNYHSHRRLRKILWGVNSIITDVKSGVPVHQKVQCLKIIYDFIREPYITSAEICDIVKYIAEEDYRENHMKIVREVFEDYFPKSNLPYQPRSLQHLSRWRIHQSLRDVGKFPGGVTRLGLPKPLTTYVLAEKPSIVYREAPDFVKYRDGVYENNLEENIRNPPSLSNLMFKLAY